MKLKMNNIWKDEFPGFCLFECAKVDSQITVTICNFNFVWGY